MRIKFNDKIYRLKEIESGVDSLMELVEEPKYKHGDFLMTRNRLAFIFDREGENGNAYHLFATDMDGNVEDDIQEGGVGIRYCGRLKDALVADQKATKAIHEGLKSIGKLWNNDKKCIEDIPKRKFKAGDKVRIKDGVSSKSQGGVYPYFEDFLDQYKVMTVKKYITTDIGEYITTSEAKRGDHHFGFAEDWLELYVEKQQRKFKAGDKVKIKDGISSKTHSGVGPSFVDTMDKFIGKELTVKEYSSRGWVVFYGDGYEYEFDEDWLEPWSDEPKVGDWVIAWDDDAPPVAGILDKIHDKCFKYRYSVGGMDWQIVIKFDGTKEHLEKVRKG